MSAREEQFENHSLHTTLSQLDSALQQKRAKQLSAGAVDDLDRIRQAAAFIRGRVEIASPLLTPSNRLDQIQKSLQGCLNEVNSFNSNGNEAHLANASNHIDTGLNNAAAIISLEQPEPSVKAKDAVSFKSLAEEIIASLRDRSNSVEERAAQIEENLQNLEKSSEDQKTQIDSLQSTIDSKLQELETQFAAAQTERSTQFEKQAEQIDQEADKKLASILNSADETLNEISDKRSEAERIVNLIGNIGLTGNFKGAVAREKRSADRMRIIALSCFIVMVGVVLGTLFLSVENGFDPWLALFRLGAALSLIVPAAYAARESSRHRTLENRNRRAELELASIDAYLESLPDDKRAEIKADLTDKFFGKISEDDKSEPDVTAESLAGLLKDAINALSKR